MALIVKQKKIEIVFKEEGTGNHAEVDADYLAYSIGSVCERTVRDIYIDGKIKHKGIKGLVGDDGLYAVMKCDNKKHFEDKMASDRYVRRNIEVKERTELDPVENCLHSVKVSLKKLAEDLDLESMNLWITVGSDNFRNEVATMKKYKANRTGVVRPYFYDTIRKYLLDEFGGKVAEGREAEDPVIELSYERFVEHFEVRDEDGLVCEIDHTNQSLIDTYKVIYVAKDKDVFQNPGHRCNPDEAVNSKDKKHFTTWQDAWGGVYAKSGTLKPHGLAGLYAQMINGDDTDNIPGCIGFGPAKTVKIIESCSTEAELLEAVHKAWIDNAINFNAQCRAQIAWWRKHGRKPDKDIKIEREESKTNKRTGVTKTKTVSVSELTIFNEGVSKIKEMLLKKDEVRYTQTYDYHHWSYYEEDEFGCPTWKLRKGVKAADTMSVTPWDALQEVATLLWIRHIKIDSDVPDDWKAPLGDFRPGFNL